MYVAGFCMLDVPPDKRTMLELKDRVSLHGDLNPNMSLSVTSADTKVSLTFHTLQVAFVRS